MVTFNPSDLDRIEAAVREAEARTAGEIVVVLSRQAASYRSLPLAAALAVSLFTPWLLLPTGWDLSTILSAQLIAGSVTLSITQWAPVRLRLIPSAIRRRRAREAAERAFAGLGIAGTRRRTGILLFVSLAERHAEVIGDAAISALLPDDAWRSLVEGFVAEVGKGGFGDAVARTVRAIGDLLARHFPPEQRPVDELPNRVVLL